MEPGCTASVTALGDVSIAVGSGAFRPVGPELDPVQLSIFSHRFMSIAGERGGLERPPMGQDGPRGPRENSLLFSRAEQMGRVLQRTAISTNIKERLDFSCALFGPDGGLVSNAPHIPVHLGAMQETVQFQVGTARKPPLGGWGGCGVRGASSSEGLHPDLHGDLQLLGRISSHPPFSLRPLQIQHLGPDLRKGDVILSNHPCAGGSHLPDLTVITPVSAPPCFQRGKGAAGDAELSLRWAPGFSCRRGEFGGVVGPGGGLAPGLQPPCLLPCPLVEWLLLIPGFLGEGAQANLLCGQPGSPCRYWGDHPGLHAPPLPLPPGGGGHLHLLQAGEGGHLPRGRLVFGEGRRRGLWFSRWGGCAYHSKCHCGASSLAAVTTALLAPGQLPGSSGTRSLHDNLSDLRAQVAANQRGIQLVNELIGQYGLGVVQAYMGHIQVRKGLATPGLTLGLASRSEAFKDPVEGLPHDIARGEPRGSWRPPFNS